MNEASSADSERNTTERRLDSEAGLVPPEVLAKESASDRVLKFGMQLPLVVLGGAAGVSAVIAIVLAAVFFVERRWVGFGWSLVLALIAVLMIGACLVKADVNRSYLDSRRERRNIERARPPEGR